ncbi:MAG TPA: hypothetical protein VD846_07420 [Allosphingosinicella sp.]|nr:hypothetical protein [Allosphingosinicella sp.]
MADDIVMDRIVAAMGQLHSGDRDGAKAAFEEIWSGLGEDGDPFHVCTLSHYMADVQDDVRSELEWDLRALRAAGRVTDGRAQQHHASLSIGSFYPSLHLNAGDAWLRLGDTGKAREHARAAEAACGALPDSPLAEMTRTGIARLARRIEEAAR